MSCKLGDKCDNVFACNILRPNVELLGCNFYKPKKPMTNEEWLKGMSTEQFAEWLESTFDLCGAGCSNCFVKELCFEEHNNKMPMDLMIEWLKEQHQKE